MPSCARLTYLDGVPGTEQGPNLEASLEVVGAMRKISVITAFLNEESNLPVFKDRVLAVFKGLDFDYEVVLVDDPSSDGGSRFAKDWANEDAGVSYVRLSRNCGSHAAFAAGLAKCTGDSAIFLAADLQDPPEVIPQLVQEWTAGHDVVWATRAERLGESHSTKLFSQTYYWLMRRLAFPDMPAKG